MSLARWAVRLGLLAAALIGSGCSSEASPGDATTEDEEVVASRCETYAVRVRAKAAVARERLRALDTTYARTVAAELDAGRVETLPFCKMTRVEFVELQKGSDLTPFGATPDEQYASLRRADAPAMKTVHTMMYGFQWENRIYVSTAMSDAMMLGTIAHEVQHVLRKAHLRNFEDQRVTCVEEIAAFEAELLLKRDVLTEAERESVHANVLDLYELDKLRPGTCGYR
jgi:hypothetical protein